MKEVTAAVREQKRRSLIAITLTLALHLLIFGTFFISHSLLFNDVVEYSGPVLVRLGRDQGVETVPKEILPEAEESEKVAPPVEEEILPLPEKTVETHATESSIPLNEEEKVVDLPLEPSQPVIPVQEVVPPKVPATAMIKGSEEGNAYETTFDAVEGLVGRTWGNAPIHLYMPLPYYLGGAVIQDMKGDEEVKLRAGIRSSDDKRKLLLFYYEESGDDEAGYEYKLKNQDSQPPFDTRVSLWFLLEDGGYDLKKAEYKDGKNPRPVVIEFSVVWKGDKTVIENRRMVSSSGYENLDEAVLYGFSKWSFYNKTDEALKGRFTYQFDR